MALNKRMREDNIIYYRLSFKMKLFITDVKMNDRRRGKLSLVRIISEELNLNNAVAIILTVESCVACVTIRLFNLINHNGI